MISSECALALDPGSWERWQGTATHNVHVGDSAMASSTIHTPHPPCIANAAVASRVYLEARVCEAVRTQGALAEDLAAARTSEEWSMLVERRLAVSQSRRAKRLLMPSFPVRLGGLSGTAMLTQALLGQS